MIVCTYIYAETNGTREMRKSVERCGHELAVVTAGPAPDAVNQQLLGLYRRAASGHKKFVYADAADSFFQRPLNDDQIPSDCIMYSTEKACYPYPDWNVKHPASDSRWKFLNGGGVCGPLDLMIEYYERYRLCSPGSMNGQAYLQQQMFQAISDGFPIKLDTSCSVFQTLAFADESEFEWRHTMQQTYFDKETNTRQAVSVELLHNTITGTVPAVLHGNGLTEMKHIYERWSDEKRA